MYTIHNIIVKISSISQVHSSKECDPKDRQMVWLILFRICPTQSCFTFPSSSFILIANIMKSSKPVAKKGEHYSLTHLLGFYIVVNSF